MIFLSVPMPRKNHHQACLGLLIIGIVGISLCMAFKDKIFTEELNINTSKGNISNKVKIQIRRDLLNYNLSLKYIAEKYRVSITSIENEMLDIISGIPKYVANLPRVISFDEFKADTVEGKYAFIINDQYIRKY